MQHVKILTGRVAVIGALTVSLTLAARPGFAQLSLSGEWRPRMHEDQPDRIPGPELGDYTGLPLTDGARLAADSWDASRLTLREHQCKVHNAPYIFHGPLQVRIWEDKDPQTQQLVAIQDLPQHLRAGPDDLDGRPAASAGIRAAHVAGILDRQVGRRHPHRLHHAHQAGVDPAQRRAEQREVHDDRALHPARQHHDAPRAVDRPGVPDRAAVAQRGVRAATSAASATGSGRASTSTRSSIVRTAPCRTTCRARARSPASSRIATACPSTRPTAAPRRRIPSTWRSSGR